MSDDKFDRFETKLDKLDERIDRIDIILTRNTDILEAHHKRTTKNEERIEFIEKHVLTMNAIFKVGSAVLAATIAAAAFALTIKQLFF